MRLNKILNTIRIPLSLLLSLLMLFSVFGCSTSEIAEIVELAGDIVNIVGELEESTEYTTPDTSSDTESPIDKDGYYYSCDEVSLYIRTYGELPQNFITKDEARDLGWEGGSVERFLDGAAIGGDVFKNREGALPKADGRIYYECDIDTNGADSRGAKRIVFSNDGLIYYTSDHYATFTLISNPHI